MTLSLELCKKLALDVARGRAVDDRPQWLKDMPSASDNTAWYYPFFYQLCKQYGPLKVLEIGTYLGSSSAHFAQGNNMYDLGKPQAGEDNVVVTIDRDPIGAEKLKALPLPNVICIIGDSMTSKNPARSYGPYDVLFIDAYHSFNSAYAEYELYRPLVKDGGLIFFDDISLDMATKEMQVLWEMIPDEKQRLDMLHYTGFGVAKKTPTVKPEPWRMVIDRATARMRALGGVFQ